MGRHKKILAREVKVSTRFTKKEWETIKATATNKNPSDIIRELALNGVKISQTMETAINEPLHEERVPKEVIVSTRFTKQEWDIIQAIATAKTPSGILRELIIRTVKTTTQQKEKPKKRIYPIIFEIFETLKRYLIAIKTH